MFGGTDFSTILTECSTSGSINHIINIGINNRLTIEINSFKFKSVICRSRFKSQIHQCSGMQSHTRNCNRVFNSCLFDHFFFRK